MKKFLALNLFIAALTFSFIYFNTDNVKTFTAEDFRNYRIEKKKAKSKAKYDKPDEAMLWYYEQRAYPHNNIPDNWRDEAYRHINLNNFSPSNSPNALSWTQLGPGNIGGRIRAIAVHPTDPNTVYFGAVAGGVWKSVDGGASWTSLNDFMANLAVCSIVIDPNNPNTIYAGTGEGFFNVDAIRGAGIFKSTDAGASWSQLASTNNQDYYYVNDLEYDAVNGVLYAATRKGLFSTSNGGSTFDVEIYDSNGDDLHFTDVEIAYTNPTTIFTAYGLFSQSEIWRSSDGGATFQANASLAGTGRIELATSKSNPSYVYVSLMDLNTNGTAWFGYSNNAGNSWNPVAIPGPSLTATTYTGGQGWYDNIVSVDPDNHNKVFAGGIDNFKSTDAGSNWAQNTNWYSGAGLQYVHADQHAMAWAPSNSTCQQ